MSSVGNESSLQVKSKLVKFLNMVLLFVFAFIIIVPLLAVLSVSLKTPAEYATTNVLDIPKNIFNIENYGFVFAKSKMLTGFKNTVIIMLISLLLNTTLGTMVSYVLGRFKFKLRNIFLTAYVISALIPATLTQIAQFQLIKGLGLYNTMLSVILIYSAANVMQVYIYLQYIDKIPISMDESATIDGASYFKIFIYIIIPMIKPAIATFIILQSIGIYNDFFYPFIYMPSNSLKTVATALYAFSGFRITEWTLMSAAVVVVLLPTILLYVFLQKYIIAGVTEGSVKG